MALELKGMDIGMQGSANVTTLVTDVMGNYSSGGINQYAVVVQDVSTGLYGDVCLPAAANAKALGVNVGSPAGPLDPVQVRTSGVARVRIASAITVGDTVSVADTSGRIQTAPTAASNYIFGVAMESGTTANQIITVLVDPSRGKVAMP